MVPPIERLASRDVKTIRLMPLLRDLGPVDVEPEG
jgi:hypothetical protein